MAYDLVAYQHAIHMGLAACDRWREACQGKDKGAASLDLKGSNAAEARAAEASFFSSSPFQ